MSPTTNQLVDLVQQIKAVVNTSPRSKQHPFVATPSSKNGTNHQLFVGMKQKNKQLSILVKDIKNVLKQTKRAIAKATNIGMLATYWEIGRLVAAWENQFDLDYNALILELSKMLTQELGKGFSRSNVYNMRKLYLNFPDFQAIPQQLTWSHLCLALVIENKPKRSFYIQESINSKWSVEELRRQIKSALFERLLLAKTDIDKAAILKLAKEGQSLQAPEDILRNPYVLEFLNVPTGHRILEKDLEQRILQHLQAFLLELGRGFMFVGSQQRVPFGNRMYYVDLVFYNKPLKAYVLIDLKIDELDPGDVGQMNAYLNYYKTEVNEESDNPPIGILLCADKHEVVAQYALGGLDNQILASTYTYYLPDEDILIEQVQKILEEGE